MNLHDCHPDIVPLHPFQESIYFDQALDFADPRYSIGGYLALTGALDLERLRAAVRACWMQSDALRVSVHLRDGVPVQRLGSHVGPAPLRETDLRGAADPAEAGMRSMLAQLDAAFDLGDGSPLVSFELMRIGEQAWYLFSKFHHLTADASSCSLAMNQIMEFYGSDLAPADAAPAYLEAVVEAGAYLQSLDYADDQQFWNGWLSANHAALEPLLARGRQPGARSGEQLRVATPELIAQLARLGQQTGASIVQLSLAALAVCFASMEGRTAWTAGIPLHNRTTRRRRRMVGLLVNTIPSAVSYDPAITLRDWLGRIKLSMLGEMRHRAYPAHHMQRAMHADDRGRALFDITINYNRIGADMRVRGVDVVAHQLVSSYEKAPLLLRWNDFGPDQPLHLSASHNLAQFGAEEAGFLLDRMFRILAAMEANLDQPLGRLAQLGESGLEVPAAWNDTARAWRGEQPLAALFERQAAARGDAVAIDFGGERMSYAALNARANLLARRLVALGVEPDTPVGLCTGRSTGMVVATLAIVKAGGAYVPLDPDYPQARLRHMLDDSGVAIVLTESRLAAGLPAAQGLTVLCIDEPAPWQDGDGANLELATVSPDNLAYVIYTSGSTRQPKGVLIEQRAVAQLVLSQDYLALDSGSVIAQASNISFDAATFEIWGALLNGGRLVHVGTDVLLDPARLQARIAQDGVQVMFVTTALFNRIALDAPASFAGLDALLFGGEAVSREAVLAVARHGMPRRLIHVYGPTEATTFATAFAVDAAAVATSRTVPIGRGMAGARMHVIDMDGNLGTAGTLGELHIEGARLARGYLNQPALTAEKFVTPAAGPLAGIRLYRTGDLVRWNAQGQIEFVGRADRQEKIRGFRIEPGEVESRLLGLRGVGEALALVRQVDGDKRLVAYVAGEAGLDGGALRAALRTELPDYMVPSAIVVMERMPLTPNGKINRAALPAPSFAVREHVAPAGATETAVAALWQQVLGLDGQPSMTANFFEQGGHSLLATRLIAAIRKEFGADIALRRMFESPTLQTLADEVSAKGSCPLAAIGAAPAGARLPLSFAQQRLWFIDTLEGGSAHYNIAGAVRLRGRLEVQALERALDAIVQRHTVLRTTFAVHDGVPCQAVQPARLTLATEDFTGAAAAAVAARIDADARRPFALGGELLLRAVLLRLDEHDHLLLLNMHHIAGDGWSLGLLGAELRALYGAYLLGQADPLPPLPIQYADYAWWQSRQDQQGEIDYWRGQLRGIPQVHGLPLDHPRPAVLGFEGALHRGTVPAPLVRALEARCQAAGASLFMGLHAVFAALLARYSGQDDIVVGSPIANREQAEVAPLIGFFVNTLVLRSDLSGQPSFEQLLAQSRETALQAYAHQQVAFERLVEALQPQRSLSHAPLFQIMLVLQNNEQLDLALPGLEVELVAPQGAVAKFDLTLDIAARDGELHLQWEYNTALFEQATIARLDRHFGTLLAAALAQPQMALRALPMLAAEERDELLSGLNQTAVDYPRALCAHQLFEARAAADGDAVAVEFGDECWTYRELNERANRLAHQLVTLGVGPDSLVGLCAERSLEMVEAVLAIVKAGGAYVPLDPNYPQARLDYMLQDSAPRVLLTQARLKERVAHGAATVLCLDDAADRGLWAGLPSDNVAPESIGLEPRHLAYVIYTSGSTGQPKGVMNEHAGLVNRLLWAQDEYRLDDSDRILQKTPFSFDVSVWEFFLPLLAGARLVMARPGGHQDPAYLARIVEQCGITTMHFVPSMLQIFLHHGRFDQCRSLRRVLCSGEALSHGLQTQFHRSLPAVELHNLYGPTEAAIDVTSWRCRPGAYAALVPIGRPIANTRIYILDDGGQPAPRGAVGELYLAGAGVARGYLNRPSLTDARFLPDPFGADPHARMYRTGDLARWLPDGQIDYLGRNDFQLKVRGLRIEPGEIEVRLTQCAGVREAVVVAREYGPGDLRLVAYVTLFEGHRLVVADLRGELAGMVADYMVPSAFVVLDAFPLSPNGKLERRSLPAPDRAAMTGSGFVAPQGERETAIAAIWSELLGAAPVGRHDNFFEQGGHSLLAVRAMSRIRAQLGIEAPLRVLFTHPELAAFCAQLGQAAPARMDVIGRADRNGALPLSWAQQRLWFLDQLDSAAGAAYHISAGLRLSGELDADALQDTLDAIAARHENLRSSFVVENGEPVQRIADADGFRVPFDRFDLRGAGADEAMLLAERFFATPFDLATGPLLRARLLRTGENEHQFLIDLHHIVMDGWSIGILVGEMSALYTARVGALADPLPPLDLQYADYARWQRDWLRGDVLRAQADYWAGQLAGAPELLALPLDFVRPAVQSYAGGSIDFALPASLVHPLRQLATRHGATLFMTFLAGWGVLMARLSGQGDVVIGTPVANRQRAELEGLIGLFVNTLALRLRVGDDTTVAQLLEQVRADTLDAYAHQDIPFEQVVEAVKPARSLSHSPVFQTLLALNNTPAAGALSLPGLEVRQLARTQQTTHFDLALALREEGDEVHATLEYATALFAPETASAMARAFVQVLRAMTAGEHEQVLNLALLDAAEHERITRSLNGAPRDYPRDTPIHRLFEAQAAARPQAVALVSGDSSVSYGELDRLANRIAHHLLALGATPGARVAICAERGIELVAGMLGILKAGAAYVPLDPGHPAERLAAMLEDSAPLALLTHSGLRAGLPAGRPVLCLDRQDWRQDLPETAPAVTLGGADLAYIMYTSGSTGQAKGVMVEHRNVVQLVIDQPCVAVAPHDRVAFCANPAFDAATWEIWVALLNGATLVVVPATTLLDPQALGDLLLREKVGVLHLTAGLFRQYADLMTAVWPSLDYLVFGGDQSDVRTLRKVFEQGAPRHLVHAYGPTETTTFTTTCEVTPARLQGRSLPIGQPIGNSQIYILDARLQPVPQGATGEIHIGGAGVARGYLNQPDTTARHFIASPFGAAGERLYKTGDLGRWQHDGQLEYLGRNDYQVKIRGYRVELGEIEARLARCPGVREALVLAREDQPGDKRLVAYLTGTPPAASELRAALAAGLAEYMIPAAFIVLDSLPLTPNGKVDRKALPAPAREAQPGRAYEAPRAGAEQALAGIWRSLLNVEQVGRHDDFFELGGHSLLATRLLAAIRKEFGVGVALRSLFELPTVAGLAMALAGAEAARGVIGAAPQGVRIPLSFAQQRLWFIDSLDGGSAHYNIPGALRLRGPLDAAALERALDAIVQRHAVLRTAIEVHDGVPCQAPASAARLRLPVEDLRGAGAADLQRRMEREARTPFVLGHDLLLRALLVELGDDDHVLLLTIHHIAGDGWSVGVLARELAALYGAFSTGGADPLPPLALQYADYAWWEGQQDLQAQMRYWEARLAGIPQVHSLPLDHARPALLGNEGRLYESTLSPALSRRLEQYCQGQGATLFMGLHAVFAALLARYSGQDDIVVGAPIANREQAELAPLIGFFVNTLVLRSDLSGAPSMQELLAQSRETALQAYANQQVPFARLVEVLQPQRSLGHAPLFQVMLALQNNEQGALHLPGLDSEPVEAAGTVAKFDLTLNVAPRGHGLHLQWEYNTALFERATIERLAAHFERLMDGALQQPQMPLVQVALLNAAERDQMLHGWNDTALDYPRDKCLHQLFEQQAARDGDACAVVWGDERLSYRTLDERANQLAHELAALGAGPERRVAVCMRRSTDMVVGLLAILKAGAAYVPLDPAYPADRIAYMLEDSAPAVLLTQDALLGSLPAGGHAVLAVDRAADAARVAARPRHAPRPALSPRNLAYVIYTSGSTGMPKGVMIEHRNVVNFVAWATASFSAGQLAQTLFATSINFDLAVYELFVPLSTGNCVVLVADVLALPHAGAAPTLINTVPSAAAALLDTDAIGAATSVLNVAGEPLKRALVERLFAGTSLATINNLYGPTETTTYSTWASMDRERGFRADIGRPVANTRVYILDAFGEPTPPGVAGEIFIGGAGVARGYLNQPRMTAERFLDDPFSAEPGARMYKTGDLGRWLGDRNIVYLGRNDFQVKIRGFRIELGEIEVRLAQCDGVREALVMAREDSPGDLRLVAYCTLRDASGWTAGTLRAELARSLPAHMVPGVVQVLDAFPLTPNGKLDRKALAAPQRAAEEGDAWQAPRGATESRLAAIMAGLLGIERVGRDANFFELGGHSLLATRLVAEVRRQFRVDLALRRLFEVQTLEGLAREVDGASAGGADPVVPAPQGVPLPLSFAQQRLWFIDRLEGSAHYNMPFAVRLEGPLDLAALERALDTIVQRHRVLRTNIVMDGQDPLQRVAEGAHLRLAVEDCSAMSGEQVALRAASEGRRPFDLARDLLLRAVLLELGGEERLLLLNLHHIAGDGWSIGVLARELNVLYGAFSDGADDPLPALALQYADFAWWQRRQGQESALAYWQQQLAGIPEVHSLPLNRPRPPVARFEGAVHASVLPAVLHGRLEQLCQAAGATLFMGLHAAFAALLSRYSGQDDIVVGSPIANREQAELAPLVGFFVNTIVLRSDLSDAPSFRQLLARSRETALQAYAHQQVPFEHLVEALQPERSLSHAPLFQVMLAMQNNEDVALRLPGLEMQLLESADTVAKFDLTLNVMARGGRLHLRWEYCAALFDHATIVRMDAHFTRLLEAALEQPEVPLRRLPLLGETERDAMLHVWNGASPSVPGEPGLAEAFERQAALRGAAVAIEFDGETMSYAALNARANRLARHLAALGVGPDTLVGLHTGRSSAMVVAMLAIVKAGGAYVPLDPAYPEARLRYMLEDSAVAIVLTEAHLAGGLQAVQGVTAVCADDASRWGHEDASNLPGAPGAHGNLAYVIYTSGSTGQPKGVLIEQRAVVQLALSDDYVVLDSASVIAQASNISFDAATFEIWGALLNGGRLVHVGTDVLLDPARLQAAIARHGVTALFVTTALFNRIALDAPDSFAGLGALLFGGEAVSREAVLAVCRHGMPRQLLHVYGPTEATTFASSFAVDAAVVAGSQTVPIGRGMAGARLHVLDAAGNLSAPGTLGELHIEGARLARGYLNQPALSADKFITPADGPLAGIRLYRTGDLVRWNADGQIEFAGRADRQEKLRGFRIELGEVEARLRRHDGVGDALALVRDTDGDRRLVAYVVGDADADALRTALRKDMPDYMVPSAIVVLERMPLTPNGKIDRAALPAPAFAVREHVAPEGGLEVALAALWQQVLGLEGEASMTANFFEQGGHSILATRLVAAIRQQFKVEVALRRLFEAPTLRALARDLAAGSTGPVSVIAPAPAGVRLPLSFAQQRLWFIDTLEGGSAHYNVPLAVRLRGRLDLEALRMALESVVRRHAALRTTIAADDGAPYQRIAAGARFEIAVEACTEHQLRERLAQHAARPFDLGADPMLRANVFRLSDDDHALMLNMHHIASDGWSVEVLGRELRALYAAYHAGQSDPLPPLAIQYGDYAWWLRGQDQGAHLAYWQRRLAGIPQAHGIPLDHARPAVLGFAGRTHESTLPPALLQALLERCQARGATLFMGLHAVLAALIGRYSGQDDIVIGTPIANREQAELAPLIGFFVNTLVLRSDLSGAPGFDALLAQSRETALEAYAHQQAPFEQLVDLLQPQRSLSHAPLFQVMLVLQNNAQAELALDGLAVEPIAAPETVAKFDLTLNAGVGPDGLTLQWIYNTALFEHGTIAQFDGHFASLLEAALAQPELPLRRLPLLNGAQRRLLLDEWNDSSAVYPSALCLHELFERQAARDGDAVAVTFGSERWTYRELNERANRLARHLVEQGVRPDSLVGLYTERSLHMVEGLLAILKAGGAYVPLDPNYPQARLDYMLQDSGVRILLTQSHLKDRSAHAGGMVLCLDDAADRVRWAAMPATDIPVHGIGLGVQHLAYVIYTSGSTGQPKGTLIEHRQVGRLLSATEQWFDFGPQDVWTVFHSYAFDFSVWEMWGALAYGGRAVIVPHLVARSPHEFLDLLEQEGVTVLNQTPTAFRALTQAVQERDADLRLRYVVFGGEALSFASLAPWYARFPNGPTLVNMYGITETTVHVTWRALSAADVHLPGSVVGRPIRDLQVYVLDADGQLLPPLIAGELHVGGAGVARGYLNKPELTAQRFVDDPFGAPGGRLYRTGDLGRYLADGSLEYLGRIDQQVKIRGFRIELGEIESQLAQCPGVASALVVVRTPAGGDQQLLAYVVAGAGGEPTAPQLRAWLQERLPEHMLPSAFGMLDAFPMTANGKIDVRALPALEASAMAAECYVAPRSPDSALLCAIWQQALDVERVGELDNFFALGGDSMLAVAVAHKARAAGLALTVRDLFQHQSIGALLPLLAGRPRAGKAAPVPPPAWHAPARQLLAARPELEDAYPLSAMQASMVDGYSRGVVGGEGVYHPQLWVRMRDPLASPDAMRRAVQMVADSQPVLRTCLLPDTGAGRWQGVLRRQEVDFIRHDLRQYDAAERQRRVDETLRQDLATPLLAPGHGGQRFHWFTMDGDEFVFAMSIHHAIDDGWGNQHYLAQVWDVYRRLCLGEPVAALAPAANVFKEYLVLEHQARTAAPHRAFWQGRRLPATLRTVREQAEDGRHDFDFVLDGSYLDRMHACGARRSVTLKAIALSAYLALVAELAGSADATVGVVANGRSERLSDPLTALGLFWNLVPFAASVPGQAGAAQLAQVHADLADVEEHTLFALKEIEVLHGGGPLFFATFNFTNFHNAFSVERQDGLAALDSGGRDRFDYPLGFLFGVSQRQHLATLKFTVDSRYIDPAVASALAVRYRALLDQLLTQEEQA